MNLLKKKKERERLVYVDQITERSWTYLSNDRISPMLVKMCLLIKTRSETE